MQVGPPIIVNGYLCRDCGDAALAAKGVDPARAGPDNPQGLSAARLQAENQPLNDGVRGRVINILV